MKEDFSGYATKAGLMCTDGRTIMPGAFQHQHQQRVPLVWQHGHDNPKNVLGHAILEHRDDGVYTYCFFNNSPEAQNAKEGVLHGDITQMSIWANKLIERAKNVLHGSIREVSLVLSGANPGALIDSVSIRHSDGDDELIDDEAVIYTGLTIIHGSDDNQPINEEEDDEDMDYEDDLEHSDGEETVQDVYDSMTEAQQTVLHFMVGEALETAAKKQAVAHSANSNGGEAMGHNIFEGRVEVPTLSHSDMQGIVADATKNGSLRDAVENFALQHGIENIDVMFPEAQALSNTPEVFGRRTEWVNELLGGTRKSPFTRIKTISADITHEEARAKGYVKGALKKEEFFAVTKRVTTPTTIYKKQKLDRDDVVDITDFDVVAWLKAEMRLMLDEELARAILIGDGRDVSHEDKVNSGNIRPIAYDHELYTTVVSVNINDAASSVQEIIDAIVMNRKHYRGTGTPTLFTSETYISRFLLLKDGMGRRMYRSLDELASELRVTKIVSVEVLEDEPELVAILVNPIDYNVGADRGGNVNMFDDFDIDYNQHKYLIETRVSGALTKLKSAIVIKKVPGASVLAEPVAPTFDEEELELSIPTVTGVVYKNAAGTTLTTGSSPYTVTLGEAYEVFATPASGYYFATSEDDTWTFFVPTA